MELYVAFQIKTLSLSGLESFGILILKIYIHNILLQMKKLYQLSSCYGYIVR